MNPTLAHAVEALLTQGLTSAQIHGQVRAIILAQQGPALASESLSAWVSRMNALPPADRQGG